jgi:hypothetical protein
MSHGVMSLTPAPVTSHLPRFVQPSDDVCQPLAVPGLVKRKIILGHGQTLNCHVGAISIRHAGRSLVTSKHSIHTHQLDLLCNCIGVPINGVVNVLVTSASMRSDDDRKNQKVHCLRSRVSRGVVVYGAWCWLVSDHHE